MKRGLELIREIDMCVVQKGSVAFWWLGQLGFVIKFGKLVTYIDPFLSEHSSRNIPSLLGPTEITNADYILGTHDHGDHIDKEVWHELSLSSPKAKFIVPKLLVKPLCAELKISIERFIGLDDEITITEGGLKISGVASAHEFLDQDRDSGSFPYLGYIIEGNGCSIYHSGDTCIYEGLQSKLRKWDKFDVMFIPINGRDGERYREKCIGNMTYQEAVDLAGTIRPGLVVPSHYEMFSFNSADPLLFANYIEAKYPKIKYWIGGHGEKVIVNREP